MKKILDLKNKTILVAGAGGRIGSKIVEDLLSLEARVVAADIKLPTSSQISELGSSSKSICSVKLDITDVKSINNALEECSNSFGTIDCAINVSYPRNDDYGKEFMDVSYESFTENLSLHLGGYFLFMQQCSRYSLERDIEFSLVNFSSIYGNIAPKFSIYEGTAMTTPVEYAAIKSAIQHLSLYVSAYTKGSKFRVNCISPGGILDNQDNSFLEKYNSLSRTKGMLDPCDITGTVAFLCSDLSKYICGQNIVVDDGFSL